MDSWTELTIYSSSEGSDEVQMMLINNGISCFAIEDPRDFNALLNDKTVPWDYIDESLMSRTEGETKIKLYLAQNAQGKEQAELVIAGLAELKARNDASLGRLEYEISGVNEADWADAWKQFFHPLKIGERFIVKPTWEPCSDKERVIIEIDPASSFGTGQHETTALCLELLEKCAPDGKNILDMGCGSGILGIGAALLGAKKVLAVDIDENAVDIARRNAEVNKLPEGVLNAICGNVLENQKLADKIFKNKYDIILANIVADIIIEMAPMFKSSLADGGILICSGIISMRTEAVLKALNANGFTIVENLNKNDWVAILAKG